MLLSTKSCTLSVDLRILLEKNYVMLVLLFVLFFQKTMSFELFQLIEQVLHNMAIAEYFKNACSNSKKLLEDLNTVKVSRWNFNLGFSLFSQCYVHLLWFKRADFLCHHAGEKNVITLTCSLYVHVYKMVSSSLPFNFRNWVKNLLLLQKNHWKL